MSQAFALIDNVPPECAELLEQRQFDVVSLVKLVVFRCACHALTGMGTWKTSFRIPMLRLFELFTDLTTSHQLGENAVILTLKTNSTGRDSWMDPQSFSKLPDLGNG